MLPAPVIPYAGFSFEGLDLGNGAANCRRPSAVLAPDVVVQVALVLDHLVAHGADSRRPAGHKDVTV